MLTFGRAAIAAAIDGLRRDNGGNPLLEFHYDDPRVQWHEVARCNHGGYPGMDVGQSRDCRWPLADGRSLHAHWHDKHQLVRFHLDDVDPSRDPLGHLFTDTKIPGGAIVGALLVGLFTESWKGAAIGAALGGLAGAGATAATAVVYRVAGTRADGTVAYARGSAMSTRTA